MRAPRLSLAKRKAKLSPTTNWHIGSPLCDLDILAQPRGNSRGDGPHGTSFTRILLIWSGDKSKEAYLPLTSVMEVPSPSNWRHGKLRHHQMQDPIHELATSGDKFSDYPTLPFPSTKCVQTFDCIEYRGWCLLGCFIPYRDNFHCNSVHQWSSND